MISIKYNVLTREAIIDIGNNYYKKYNEKNELKPTPEILKWTNQYQENTDLYLQFINENTEENNDEIIHIDSDEDIDGILYKYSKNDQKIIKDMRIKKLHKK